MARKTLIPEIDLEEKKEKRKKYEIFISSSEGIPLLTLHADTIKEAERRSEGLIERGFIVTLSKKKKLAEVL